MAASVRCTARECAVAEDTTNLTGTPSLNRWCAFFKLKDMLQEYDFIPDEMRAYLRNNGRHFNRKSCEWAVRQMRGADGRRIEALDKDAVETMLKNNGVELERNKGYDHVYVANMCRADFYGTAIDDERHFALYVKCVIDDPDAVGGMVFNRWLADCDSKGVAIDWEELL